MVGIVIVSHSKKASEGIVEMAKQIAGDVSPIIAAGGMADGSIGTDAVKIKKAIESILTADGVVVLADLGSAIFSSEMAIELLDDPPGKVVIADAPCLEGAVGAAVQASLDVTLEEVVAAAEEARNLRKI